MKQKIILLFACIIVLSQFAFGKLVYQKVQQVPSSSFKKIDVFNYELFEKDIALSSIVSTYDAFQINEQALQKIATQKPEALEIQVPIDGIWQSIRLIKSSNVDENTLFASKSGSKKEFISYTPGAYYVGVLNNNSSSIVGISFFEHDIIGVVSNASGNYVIGKKDVRNYYSTLYISYNDANLLVKNKIDCHTQDENTIQPFQPNMEQIVETVTTNCVKVYIECDYAFYQMNSSSVTQSMNLATGIFNLTVALNLNDSISTGLSEVDVWTSPDPYATLATTSDILNSFGVAMAPGFNGDLAHFFSSRPLGGGIAWVDVLCFSPQYQVAVSAELNTTITPLPTYSWNASVVTHEMGHNLGSKHTHACAWNGNNTRIDNCGGHAGYPSGSCADILPDPPAGGTMMSYCHLVAVGVNFNLGFGPQPGALVRSRVNAAPCLTPCATCIADITISNIFTDAITQSDTWIETSGQTTIQNNVSVKLDADSIDGYVLLKADANTDFFLSSPNTTNYFVAQALDGCGVMNPARQQNPYIETENDLPINSSFRVYPVPATESITLHLHDGLKQEITIEIIGMDGKVVIAKQKFYIVESVQLYIAPLSPGVYLMKIYTPKNVEAIRFQKER
jgi:hypothetical protein